MDEVTVEDADAGEVIETIMVDESVDVPISVSGEDSSVPVTVVDESIPIETLQPLLLAASNPLQSLAGNLGPVPVVEPALEVESPLEIVPQVNLDALNRFLVDPINAAANAKIDALNDLGLAAGNIGNILSSNIIDTANAQVNNTYCFP